MPHTFFSFGTGFHPSQIANALTIEVLWPEYEKLKLLPPVNPNNALIAKLFGDQVSPSMIVVVVINNILIFFFFAYCAYLQSMLCSSEVITALPLSISSGRTLSETLTSLAIRN